MSIVGAIMTPHPPLIIPQVGRGQEKGIAGTVAAMERAATFVAELAPETVVVVSPHATAYADYCHISPGTKAAGSFAQYGARDVRIEVDYDAEFVNTLSALCEKRGVSAGTQGEREPVLDHATMIQLYFLEKAMPGGLPQVVRIGISGQAKEDHYRLGMLIAETAEALGRRTAIVASGDLSHKLTADGPYGLSPDGAKYDEKIMGVMSHADFGALFDFTEGFCSSAAECGHRSFVVMAGCFDGKGVTTEQLSYEGPFGVGYGVCTFAPGGIDPARCFLETRAQAETQRLLEARDNESPYVRLARQSFTAWVTQRKHIPVPDGLPAEITGKRAGVFVSLHKAGQLRGCIGTISPTQESIAEEIIQNAISACAHDPRFSPVKPEELPAIECSVDVLGDAEDIVSTDQLDVQRYGVIVQSGHRRGLLLPALDGVDTVEEQVDIARRKAGIAKGEPVKLQRFEVIRYH